MYRPPANLRALNLENTTNSKSVSLLDTLGLIMDEYQSYCSYAGAPGTGDMFFKYLHDNRLKPVEYHVLKSNLRPTRRGFSDLPPNQLDPSDWKFLAVAKAGAGQIVNATDSDWLEQDEFIASLNVVVRELCPENNKAHS